MSAKFVIEQDGPRFRWVLMLDDRRCAKAAKWWDTMDEAEDDAERFADAVQQNPPMVGP